MEASSFLLRFSFGRMNVPLFFYLKMKKILIIC